LALLDLSDCLSKRIWRLDHRSQRQRGGRTRARQAHQRSALMHRFGHDVTPGCRLRPEAGAERRGDCAGEPEAPSQLGNWPRPTPRRLGASTPLLPTRCGMRRIEAPARGVDARPLCQWGVVISPMQARARRGSSPVSTSNLRSKFQAVNYAAMADLGARRWRVAAS
jgi:hypothetical protein